MWTWCANFHADKGIYGYDNVFEYYGVVPLCQGFEVEVGKNTHDRRGNIVGSSERWEFSSSNGEITSSLRHFSHSCSRILARVGSSEVVVVRYCSELQFSNSQ
jgi:hypothetical protein